MDWKRLALLFVLADFSALCGMALEARATPTFARRFVADHNPPLAELLASTLGPRFAVDAAPFTKLESLAFEAPFRAAFRKARRRNRERLAAFITSLPAPVFINDGMLSQPWFTSQSRYPAYVPDQLWMEIAQRDGWLPPDWIDTLIRDRAFGAFLLPDDTRWVEVGRAAGCTAERVAGRDDGREYLVLR